MKSSLRPWRTVFALLAGVVVLSFIAVEPPVSKKEAAAQGSEELGGPDIALEEAVEGGEASTGGGTAGGSSGGSGGSGSGPTKQATSGRGPTARGGGDASAEVSAKGLECKAGRNGGQTAPGVSGKAIKLASTNVRSGTGASFLGSSYIGMQAVVNRVNAAGGVCGRLLQLRLVDDGWSAATGAGFIENFAEGDYFALPVVPSSEGLTQAITNKTISNKAIPVVGTDGMLKEQYADPWVWPVATSTVSTMRVMAKYARDKGAKTFGIVYDSQYKFGKEGAEAYKRYVKQLTGSDPAAAVPITPGRGSYSGEAQQFNEGCAAAGGCDFVAMLLTPETAATYISSQSDKDGKRQGFGRMMTGGAQPLFNERFARDCGRPCDGMLVWTGYNPPIGRLSSEKDVAAYVDDVKSVDPGVDVNNQFLEGAYLGMKVFVAALEKVGPNLTRPALQQAMDSMSYESGLSAPLRWAPNHRFANQSAQAFRIVTASGSFAGFAEAGSGFLVDPTPGVVPD